MTCTTCGQHYFVHHVRDFTFTDRVSGGGEAVANRVIWRPLEEQLGGDRVVLLDRLVIDAADDDDDATFRRGCPIELAARTVSPRSADLQVGCYALRDTRVR
jgi:hypothetical protein